MTIATIPPYLADDLRRLGVGSIAQLAELPNDVITGMKNADHVRDLAQANRPIDGLRHVTTPHAFGALRPTAQTNPVIMARSLNGARHARLLDRLGQLQDLPSAVSLVDQFPDIGDQLTHGACVGFATSDSFEFLTGRSMSPWGAHRAAKEADNQPDVEGTFQYYALAHFFKTGHLRKPHYGYQDWLQAKPLSPLANKAAKHRIDGFVDLLSPVAQYDYFPDLARAILAGRIKNDRTGGDPITISITLYDSYLDHSTEHTGMFRLNLPGETVVDGHAMVIVGYRDADDPGNPFGIGYFIARNSWGDWAAGNPFGYPGHALIPYSYVADRARLFEAYWLLG